MDRAALEIYRTPAVTSQRGRCTLVAYPWSAAHDPSVGEDETCRPCLDVGGAVEQVVCDASRHVLPCVGEWTAEAGDVVRRFQLPSGSRPDPRANGEQVSIWLEGVNEGQTLLLDLPAALPSLAQLRNAESATDPETKENLVWPTEVMDSAEWIQSTLGRYVEFVNELYDQPRSSSRSWEGQARDLACRSLVRLTARWRRIEAVDAPPMAMIVKLARRLHRTLEPICMRPRRVLRRDRSATPVAKIQEVDVGCLQWLARQPGRTLIEKAGRKQELRAVRRFEDVDTPENRVVRDLLVRCTAAGRRYVRENARFYDHDRVRLVRRFASQCSRLLRDTPIGQVGRLASAPQPNYVLLYEPTYRVVWDAYQTLIRQQRQEDALWRWRQNTWGEMCRVAVMAAFQRIARRSPAARSDTYLSDEETAGQFLDARSVPAAWWVDGLRERQVVHLLNSFDLRRFLPADSQIVKLCPDFVIHRVSVESRGSDRMTLCWSFCADRAGADALTAAISLQDRLANLPFDVPVDVVLFWASETTAGYLTDLSDTAERRFWIATVPYAVWREKALPETVVRSVVNSNGQV